MDIDKAYSQYEIISFDDSYNDASMIKYAVVGIIYTLSKYVKEITI